MPRVDKRTRTCCSFTARASVSFRLISMSCGGTAVREGEVIQWTNVFGGRRTILAPLHSTPFPIPSPSSPPLHFPSEITRRMDSRRATGPREAPLLGCLVRLGSGRRRGYGLGRKNRGDGRGSRGGTCRWNGLRLRLWGWRCSRGGGLGGDGLRLRCERGLCRGGKGGVERKKFQPSSCIIAGVRRRSR